MIYWELFTAFFYTGCFTFGGAYAAIPLIRDVVMSHGWLSDAALTDMIAVSESTPGPIMVNLATYVGSSQGGLPGALLATAAVCLPAFVIVLAAVAVLERALKNRLVRGAFDGLTACITGIILATGIYLTLKGCVTVQGSFAPDGRALLIAAAILAVRFLAPRLTKKKLSPIATILAAAILGAVVYGI